MHLSNLTSAYLSELNGRAPLVESFDQADLEKVLAYAERLPSADELSIDQIRKVIDRAFYAYVGRWPVISKQEHIALLQEFPILGRSESSEVLRGRLLESVTFFAEHPSPESVGVLVEDAIRLAQSIHEG